MADEERVESTDEIDAIVNEVIAERGGETDPEPNTSEPEEASQFASDTEEPEVAEQTEEPSSESTDDWLTDDYKDLAEGYGLSPEQARQFDDADSLERHLEHLDKTLAGDREAQEQNPDGADPEKSKDPPQGSEPAKLEGFDLLEGIDLEAIDPDAASILKTMNDRASAAIRQQQDQFNQKLDELRPLLESADRASQAFEEQKFNLMIDTALNEHSEALFGRGSGYDLKQAGNNKAWDNRDKVAAEVLDIYENRAKRGLPPLPGPIAVKRAVNALFADELQKQSQAAIQQTLTKSSRRKLGAPGGPAPTAANADTSSPVLPSGEVDPEFMKELEASMGSE